MATQRIYWECNVCKRMYEKQAQATACEEHHAELAELKVIDMMDTGTAKDTTFPEKILLQDPQCREVLAEYQFCRAEAPADFYQSEAYWHEAVAD